MSKSYIAGLTGGIGSGKTTVAKIFSSMGVPIFYADTEAANIVNTHTDIKQQIIELFGKDIYGIDGILKRKELASQLFSNENLLQQLNAIVHPRVQEVFFDFVNTATFPYVIKEAAILFESGSYKDCDTTIMVYAPEAIRIQRVMARDNRTEKEILDIIAQQMNDEEKRKLAEYVIVNDNSESLILQVSKVHTSILQKLKK